MLIYSKKRKQQKAKTQKPTTEKVYCIIQLKVWVVFVHEPPLHDRCQERKQSWPLCKIPLCPVNSHSCSYTVQHHSFRKPRSAGQQNLANTYAMSTAHLCQVSHQTVMMMNGKKKKTKQKTGTRVNLINSISHKGYKILLLHLGKHLLHTGKKKKKDIKSSGVEGLCL